MPRSRGTGSVYLQKGSAVYWVKYYRNGKAYRESTRETDERKAQTFLSKRLGEIVTGNFSGSQGRTNSSGGAGRRRIAGLQNQREKISVTRCDPVDHPPETVLRAIQSGGCLQRFDCTLRGQQATGRCTERNDQQGTSSSQTGIPPRSELYASKGPPHSAFSKAEGRQY